jgi:hypothetical protein
LLSKLFSLWETEKTSTLLSFPASITSVFNNCMEVSFQMKDRHIIWSTNPIFR